MNRTSRLLSLAMLLAALPALGAEGFDVVIRGGRVMDPETGLDAVRNLGIRDGRIVRITEEALTGRRTIDANGLVVAPGFIDLHQHGQTVESGRVKALDGVTTALEMEIGVSDVAAFLARKAGHSVIHYGSTASHAAARAAAFGTPLTAEEVVPRSGHSTNDPASAAQLRAMEDRIGAELDAGALGIGMGIQYTPGATRAEVIDMFRVAARRNVPVFTHVRSFGRLEPGSSIEAVSEVIGAAAISGAALQIVHINSSCIQDGLECVSMVAGARARGLDVTTEAYPYVAGMTAINSALFDGNWREKLGVDYDAIQIPDSGERLTKQRFEELHHSPKPVGVLLFVNQDAMVDAVISQPLVSIASDGEDGHPRNAGTFSRVLAHHVRDLHRITLMDALRKMSLMPAQRLEKSAPSARRKGRLQEGADADVVVFDAETVADRATYAKPREPSVGIRYVLVAGTPVVADGKFVADTYPGQAIRGEPLSGGSPRP